MENMENPEVIPAQTPAPAEPETYAPEDPMSELITERENKKRGSEKPSEEISGESKEVPAVSAAGESSPAERKEILKQEILAVEGGAHPVQEGIRAGEIKSEEDRKAEGKPSESESGAASGGGMGFGKIFRIFKGIFRFGLMVGLAGISAGLEKMKIGKKGDSHKKASGHASSSGHGSSGGGGGDGHGGGGDHGGGGGHGSSGHKPKKKGDGGGGGHGGGGHH